MPWRGLVSTHLDKGASTAVPHGGKGSAELPMLPGRVNAVVQDRVDGGDIGRGSIGETFHRPILVADLMKVGVR